MLCGGLSYLEWRRRASGVRPRYVSGFGARLGGMGDQGVKEVQKGGSDGLGHLGWLVGERHVTQS